jgi:beta-N-acetylhexosaminidase
MTGGTVRSGSFLPRRALPRGGLWVVGRERTAELLLGGLTAALALCLLGGLVRSAAAAAAPQPEQQRAGRATQAPLDASGATAMAAPTVRELVGQRFVVAMGGTSPSAALLGRVRRGEVGGVILFGANVTSPTRLRRLTTTLQRTAREAKRPPLLIATDQEGGRVRRLPWAGPLLSTTDLGRLRPARIAAEAAAAGKALRLAGVNVDLAPVADVPLAASFLALEQRTFASTPAAVSEAAVAFAQGLAGERVAAAVKHFPGIGRATRNTDRAAVEITATRAQILARDLPPFRSAIAAGVPLVMISNATYPALDTKPAAWSTRIQSLLRQELGFDGVTISDALDGAASTRGRTLLSVAVLVARAGVDLLLLTGSEASSAAAFERVVATAEQGRLPIGKLQASYRRILELKRVYA